MSQNVIKVNQSEENVAKESILINQFGCMIQVRALIFSEQSVSTEPMIKDGKIKLLTFESMSENTQWTFTGDFFCWTVDSAIKTFNVKT